MLQTLQVEKKPPKLLPTDSEGTEDLIWAFGASAFIISTTMSMYPFYAWD